MGEERSIQPQSTTIWHGASLRDSFLTVVQNAGSQEIRNGLVEDFRTALDMLAQAAPASNISSTEPGTEHLGALGGRNDRADTVIVVDEDGGSSSSSSSGTRHRLTPNVSGNQFGRTTTKNCFIVADGTDSSEEHIPANDPATNTNLQRELSRLRSLVQSTELQRQHFFFFILQTALLWLPDGLDSIYIPMAFMSRLTKPVTFFATLHVVLVVDFAVKIITVVLKAGLTVLPTKFIGNRRLRRLFQWIEYTSQFYRYILPIPQWTRYLSYSLFSTPLTYFGDHFFAVLYIIYKACLIQIIGRRWFESTRRIFRLTSVGSKVSVDEEDSVQCTICFNDFCNPIRLSCGHIFCEECIGTWLDNEHTCPMCRATVAQEDNMWKSGETTYSPQLC
uniref:RING-type domain-containing protein n=1 Tax=Setaria digitata TaxID=48799 RepID=A0A915Q4Y8_9BILA